MQQIIVSVGKRHDSSIASSINEFTIRLSRVVPTTWHLIKPSGADEPTARRTESAQVLSFIDDSDFVILCDERGRELSSTAFAGLYNGWTIANKRLVVVIGGAYGVDASLHNRANFTWSLSQLVFPHQLVRLIVAEQLYRATTIIQNHPYHHT